MEAQDNVILMRLGEESAKRMLSEIAADTKNVKFTTHARERMKERQITSAQILRCLRHGRITEGPAREASGNWKLNVEVISAGQVLVVTVVLDNRGSGNYALIITAFYGG
ncbi:MAG: DUF4258 domain-containing protein [Halothiobacillaceae bacterium]|nr:DUF4258 domain-containing protein [Halothiobacillaceae bacterium]